jgi:hypothetical protein
MAAPAQFSHATRPARKTHGSAHSPRQRKTLLLSEWDPISVGDEPAAKDEYDAYAAIVVDMIDAGRSEADIADYLVSIEADAMGLEADRRRAEAVAAKLMALA